MTEISQAAASFDADSFALHLAAAREQALNLDWREFDELRGHRPRFPVSGAKDAVPAHRAPISTWQVARDKIGRLGVGQATRHLGHRIERLASGYHVTGPSGDRTVGTVFDAAKQIADHQIQRSADEAAKQHGQFVAQLARSRPSDINGFKDVVHPSGAKVRLFGGSGQGVEDTRGHFAYHSSLDSAAKAAALDRADVGSHLSQAPGFDYRRYRLHLADQLSDADDADDYRQVLLQALKDATDWRDRLRAAGSVAPEVLRAAEQAVTDAQRRLDDYDRSGNQQTRVVETV